MSGRGAGEGRAAGRVRPPPSPPSKLPAAGPGSGLSSRSRGLAVGSGRRSWSSLWGLGQRLGLLGCLPLHHYAIPLLDERVEIAEDALSAAELCKLLPRRCGWVGGAWHDRRRCLTLDLAKLAEGVGRALGRLLLLGHEILVLDLELAHAGDLLRQQVASLLERVRSLLHLLLESVVFLLGLFRTTM